MKPSGEARHERLGESLRVVGGAVVDDENTHFEVRRPFGVDKAFEGSREEWRPVVCGDDYVKSHVLTG